MTLKGKHRSHEYQGGDEFLENMNKLIADGIDLKVEVDTDNKSAKSAKSAKGNASATKKSTRSSKPQLKSA